MTPRVLDWDQAFQAGAARCGGKGFNLARLARYGFNVPAGGVLTAEAYGQLLMSAPDLACRAGELAGLGHGEVLVAPSTDPGRSPLRACAIVMETGGYLSHGAIVAREYGIPAVVNIPGLLDQVRDGERLLVDGDAGRVAPVAGQTTQPADSVSGPSAGAAAQRVSGTDCGGTD